MRVQPPLAQGRSADTSIAGRRTWARRLLFPLLVLALAFAAWPYVTVWRLDRALAAGDPARLAGLVDLDAVRGEIRRKINKDSTSAIDRISDGFIDWLAQGIRRDGTDALDRLVTLEWVRERLLSKSPPGEGLLPAVSGGFFDGPLEFSFRLGTPGADPVFVRMGLGQLGWRVTALWY